MVILGGFLAWERFQAEPLLPLGLFRNRNYSIMVWLSGVNFFAMFGFMFVVTIYLQSVLGMSAIQAGLTTIPLTLGMSAVAPFAGRLTDRLGGRYILMGGSLLFAAGIAGVARVASLGSDSLTFAVPLALAGVGMGCMIAPMMTEAMRDIAPAMAGAASGLLNTSRQLGAAVGAAVIGAVLQNQLASALHAQAVAASTQLPPQFRSSFVDGFATAAKQGLQLGRGQNGAVLPHGIPAQVAHVIQGLIHEVFLNAFLTAMRPTMLVSSAALLLAALTCVLIVRRLRLAAVPAPSPVDAVIELAS